MAAVGSEIGSAIEHYSEHGPFDEPSDVAGGCAYVDSETVGALLVDADISAVEKQVSGFLNYWSGEVVGWVFLQMMERGDLEPLLEKYFDENSDYLAPIMEAATNSIEIARGDLLAVIDEVVTEHTAGLKDDLSALLFGDPGNGEESGLVDKISSEIAEAIMDLGRGKLEEMKSEEIPGLIEDEGKIIFRALKRQVATLPPVLPGSGYDERTGGDLPALLNEITRELPFAALTDLVDETDIKEFISGLCKLAERIPFDKIAPYLEVNADNLGHSAAHILLNGIADSIEFPEPEDPRIEEIMAALLSEERLRRFYQDLGGKDLDKITPESDTGSIILAILLEVAGDEARMERFRKEFTDRSGPVLDDLLYYGKRLGDWLLGSLRSFARPFLKRVAASFLAFTPRGYKDQFGADPAKWIDYNRVADDARTGGMLIGEVLTGSMAGRFLDESLFSFLVDHETLEDFASPEHLGVINHFLAEITDAEQLKTLRAEDGTRSLFGLIRSKLNHLREVKTDALIKPNLVSRGLNSLTADLLGGFPGDTIRISSKDLFLSPVQLVEKMTMPIDSGVVSLRKDLDNLIPPLGNIPADLFGDIQVRSAGDGILGETSEMTLDLAARIVEDPRLDDLISSSATTMLDLLLDKALDVADNIVQDPRLEVAIEEAVTTVLTGNDLPLLLGNLAGDLLEDELFLDFVDDLLDASRIIAVGDYQCPVSDQHYHPENFLGGLEQEHGFEGYPSLPRSYRFSNKSIPINIYSNPRTITAYHFFFRMGCNNGLYTFSEELRNWLDPGIDYPHQTLGTFIRDYVPRTYLTEARVREELSRPLSALLAGTLEELPGERDVIKQLTLACFEDMSQKPLQAVADHLRIDSPLRGLLKDHLAGLPYHSIEDRLRDNTNITDLLEKALAVMPLEETTCSFRDSRALKSIVSDTAVSIDLAPLRPLLRIDRELPEALLQQVQSFPANRVADFLMSRQHLYRAAYMGEDLKTRFLADLLIRPDLIALESDLSREKVAEANYCLAQGTFKIAEKFAGSGSLIDYVGKYGFDLIGKLYLRANRFIRSLFGLPGDDMGTPSPASSKSPDSRCPRQAIYKKEGP